MNKTPKHITTSLLRSRWFYVVNGCLVLIVAVSFGREVIHSRDIAKQIRALEEQSVSLQAEQLSIQELKNAVQTKSFVEGEARLKLGLQKPGESLVIVKDAEKDSVQQKPVIRQENGLLRSLPQEEHAEDSSLANSTKWWYYFFHKQAYRDAM